MTVWESTLAEDWAVEQAQANPESAIRVLKYLLLQERSLNQQIQALKLISTIRGYAAFN